LPALFFWALTDLEYKRLLVIQLFTMPILLLEKLLLVPLAIYLGLTKISSPFSLGIITQYITENGWLIYFFANLSILKNRTNFLEYKEGTAMTDKNPKLILLMVIAIQLVIWLFVALLSFIRMENIL